MGKRLSIDEILEKAFTAGDLTAGGLLNPEQAAQFVQGVIDQAVILPLCRREPMRADKRQIDKITYTGNVMQKPPAVGTAPTTTVKPTTSKVTLSANEVILAIDVGYDALEDSIEGASLFDTIMGLTQKKVALEMDTLILHGNTAGGTGDYLEILDGVFAQVDAQTTYKHLVDAKAATLSKDVLFNVYKAMPGKYIDQESNFGFFTSHLARLDYIQSLAGIAVNEAFVRYLVGGNKPAYQGIEVQKVGAIQTESISGGTPGTQGSKMLFCNPKNIVWGVHRDMTYEFDRQPRKRIIEVTMTMRVDVKLEEADAVVVGENIKHSTN
jgi:HK97 family phage major capsid protein